MKPLLKSALVLFALSACSSVPSTQRERLDWSSYPKDAPTWTQDLRESWESADQVELHSRHQARGDERTTACVDLARMNAHELLVTQISQDIRGRIDDAQSGLSESAENVFGKTRTAEFQGRVQGLKIRETFFERYRVDGVERLECHALAEINQSDYRKLKRAIVDRVVEADPRLKEAVLKNQIDFFNSKKPD